MSSVSELRTRLLSFRPDVVCSYTDPVMTSTSFCDISPGTFFGKTPTSSVQKARIELTFFFKINLFIIFIYVWPRWVFIAACGLSLVAVSGGYSSLRCAGFSLQWLLLWSTGPRRVGFSSCGVQALERRLSSCGARA